ncbi:MULTISPECIES: lipopolysaccharide heptosyltransferase I [Rhodopseudomonas]|uniref:Lipopolysaccharide heptosyltransferase 1 n=1 Tax=Rhodopseudomonas palustris TaxID=1076 RepID=A0A0D7EJT4_RHOPL|nr:MULTISPECIES: lipopolysaccharide heptosyltransferase I [Rhodopseudomonas]KIZ40901.1 glycosyl transferase family 1 [Rhodopseudomonas palustris]MDF3812773.1 lipopolysaccharide heptosyltransferase I [Rhodopseudomonas sp. BAL398]WOK20340.1 lipopolysaccharide heptosyltransferase I [Rhodopseudomonas sp. BAL398]
MTNILIVKTSSLGDVVHQMPAITDAARLRPELRMTWVVEEAFAPLARLHPAIAEVIPVATRRWRSQLLQRSIWREIAEFRSRLRRGRFDKVIDTQGLIRSALIAWSATGEHHGYDAASIREPLAARFYDVTHAVGRDLHAVTRNRLLTGLALGYQPPAEVDYGLIKPQRSDAPPYAVLLHGTSRVAKEWRESDWIETGRWLRGRGVDVVLPWGTEKERLLSERLCHAIDGSRVLARQRLDATAQVIANAALVIGVDTGLLHLAAAYRVPLVAIFVSTDPGLTGPVGSGAMSVLGGKTGGPSAPQTIAAAQALLG